MQIGIIGARNTDAALTWRFTGAGHEVSVANSRRPETLAALAAETGAKAVSADKAARAGEVVVATIPLTLAQHPPSPDRSGKTLHGRGAKTIVLEEPTCEPARGFGDDNRVRLRQSLQPGGEMGRGPDEHLVLCRSFADEVAYHHEAGRDPDPRGQRLTIRSGQAAHRRRHGETSPDRSLGIVLVRVGPTEIGQHPVAHELGDVPVQTEDLVGHSIPVSPKDLARDLGIEARAQSRGADQVDEHHGQVAALRLVGRSCRF